MGSKTFEALTTQMTNVQNCAKNYFKEAKNAPRCTKNKRTLRSSLKIMTHIG